MKPRALLIASALVCLLTVVGCIARPAWSPDGKRIAFMWHDGQQSDIHVVNADGTGWEILTDTPTDETWPTWSPDGARIAFVAKPDKSEEQEAYEKERGRPDVWDEFYPDEWSHLWVAALEKGRAQEAERVSPEKLYVSGFVWAPDSKRLAFAGRPSPALRARGQGNVYITNEAGINGEPRLFFLGERPCAGWTWKNRTTSMSWIRYASSGADPWKTRKQHRLRRSARKPVLGPW